MKKISFLTAFFLLVMGKSYGQSISISWTCTLNGEWTAPDSVVIENFSSSQCQTIYYPDTMWQIDVTGINHPELSEPCLKIYPNPISGKAKLKFSLAEPQPVSIRVFDLTGKIVLSGQYDLCAGEHFYRLNLSSQGCYCVQVQTYKNNYTQKIINTTSCTYNRLQYEGCENKTSTPVQKAYTTMEGHIGDTLNLVVIKTIDSTKSYTFFKQIQFVLKSDTNFNISFDTIDIRYYYSNLYDTLHQSANMPDFDNEDVLYSKEKYNTCNWYRPYMVRFGLINCQDTLDYYCQPENQTYNLSFDTASLIWLEIYSTGNKIDLAWNVPVCYMEKVKDKHYILHVNLFDTMSDVLLTWLPILQPMEKIPDDASIELQVLVLDASLYSWWYSHWQWK